MEEVLNGGVVLGGGGGLYWYVSDYECTAIKSFQAKV